MGASLSQCVPHSRSNRVSKIIVSADGVIHKHPTSHPAHGSYLRLFFRGCCAPRYTLESTVNWNDGNFGRPGFKWKRIFHRNQTGLVAPVAREDTTWAIPRHNFSAFKNGNFFITSSNRGGLRRDSSGTVVNSSGDPSPCSSDQIAILEDPVANANLRTLLSFKKGRCISDAEVMVELDDGATNSPATLVQPTGVVEACALIENSEDHQTSSNGGQRGTTAGVHEGSSSVHKAKAEFKHNNTQSLQEPQAIIAARPSFLVDVSAGDILGSKDCAVLLSRKKDDGGPQDASAAGGVVASLPSACVSWPPSLFSYSSPPLDQGVCGDLLAAPVHVGSFPLLGGQANEPEKTLLHRRAMLYEDVFPSLPSQVPVSVTIPTTVPQHVVKLRNIVQSGGDKKSKAKTTCKEFSDAKVKDDSDSEEEIEYFDANGKKIPKQDFIAQRNCSSQAQLMVKESELPPAKKPAVGKESKALSLKSQKKQKKKGGKKKNKAKRRDSIVVPSADTMVERLQASPSADLPFTPENYTLPNVFWTESDELTRDVVTNGRHGNNGDNGNKDEDSEEEIEYFSPDGRKIPTKIARQVIFKTEASVHQKQSCSASAQVKVKEPEKAHGRKSSSCRGAWM